MKNKKQLGLKILIIISAISIVTIIVIMLVLGKKSTSAGTEIDIDKLEMQFEDLFTSEENEYVSTAYNIEENKNGEYSIYAKIPSIHISNSVDSKVNKEINDIFIKKMLEVYNNSRIYTKLSIDYATTVNDNILSLAIRCTLKEGATVQRKIIKTYNIRIPEGEILGILSIIPSEQEEGIQEKINRTIQNNIKKENEIIMQGYQTYKRDIDSDIYLIENATEFYVKNNVLYIIYSYGNNNYTSEIDLIVTTI